MKTIIVSGLMALGAAMLPVSMADAQEAPDALETSSVSISSANGDHAFSVEVADEADEISYGLMNRESLGADAGMLFDFGTPREPGMYMKNTLIPLDMLFITPDGTVLMIARNTVPGSLRTISPGARVKAVLEISGGRAAELGIEPGDTVVHTIFGNDDNG
jgi:uncharacterized membrane protein (UPF0127 family)